LVQSGAVDAGSVRWVSVRELAGMLLLPLLVPSHELSELRDVSRILRLRKQRSVVPELTVGSEVVCPRLDCPRLDHADDRFKAQLAKRALRLLLEARTLPPPEEREAEEPRERDPDAIRRRENEAHPEDVIRVC
jgi:hypothetical protein